MELEILEEICKMDDPVQVLIVTQDSGTRSPTTSCALRTRALEYPPTPYPLPLPTPNPLLFAWKRNKGLNLKTITFPIYSEASQIIYLANILGGTVLGESMMLIQLLLQAKAMWLQYYQKDR